MYKRLFYILLSTNVFFIISILSFFLLTNRGNILSKKIISLPKGGITYSNYTESQHIMNTKIKKSPILFLGNSIIHQGNWNELFPAQKTINRGIPGDKIMGMYSRVDSTLLTKCSNIVLMAGINDLLNNSSVKDCYTDYLSLINKCDNNTHLVVCSTLYTSYDQEVNKQVKTLNKLVKNYCIKSGITFINLNSILCEKQKLNIEYTYDGLHLNIYAYLKWKEVLINKLLYE